MTTIDSKIFLGCPLGNYNEILPKLLKLYPMEDFEIYKYVEYLNLVLPGNIFINITYPKHGAPVDQIVFHLDLLSDECNLTINELQNIINSLDLDAYKMVLRNLEMKYITPILYSQVYVY